MEVEPSAPEGALPREMEIREQAIQAGDQLVLVRRCVGSDCLKIPDGGGDILPDA